MFKNICFKLQGRLNWNLYTCFLLFSFVLVLQGYFFKNLRPPSPVNSPHWPAGWLAGWLAGIDHIWKTFLFKVFKGNIIVIAVNRKLGTGKQGSLTSRKDNGPMAQLCWRKNGKRFHKRKRSKRLKREAPSREEGWRRWNSFKTQLLFGEYLQPKTYCSFLDILI